MNGKLIGRILVIFERVSFIAILELIDEDNWEVVERGTLRNYDDLINYIEKARIQM